MEVDNGERWRATREDFLELNKASTRIKLRLNAIECDSRLILQSLREMEDLFKDLKSSANRTDASFDRIFGIVSALERDAAPLLKKEWVRVKEGEPIYRRAKWLAVSAFVLSVMVTIYFLVRLLR